jgi:hypothetical protein
VIHFHFRITPAKLSRSANQHLSNSAHLMRRFVQGLSIYVVYQLFIPSLIPDVCNKHIPNHSKHHRQRDASLTAKLDLAPPLSQSPSHVYNVLCLSNPATAFLKCRKRAFYVHAKTTSRATYHPRDTDRLHAPKYVVSTLLRP